MKPFSTILRADVDEAILCNCTVTVNNLRNYSLGFSHKLILWKVPKFPFNYQARTTKGSTCLLSQIWHKWMTKVFSGDENGNFNKKFPSIF